MYFFAVIYMLIYIMHSNKEKKESVRILLLSVLVAAWTETAQSPVKKKIRKKKSIVEMCLCCFIYHWLDKIKKP